VKTSFKKDRKLKKIESNDLPEIFISQGYTLAST
jgi:hypothetical protein